MLHLGEVSAARLLFDRALTIQLASFGAEHPNTGLAMANLASAVRQEGDIARARALLEQAENIFVGRLGEHDPATQVVRATLQHL